jgi:hypothetical protein
MKHEARYLLQRASEEARQALSAEQPEAAEVHEALSIRYSAKAVTLIADEDEEGAGG